MIILLKVVAFVWSLVLFGMFGFVTKIGIQARQARRRGRRDSSAEEVHPKIARFWLKAGVLNAVPIEAILIIRYGFNIFRHPHLPGFLFHLTFGVMPFLVLGFSAAYWITGNSKKYKKWHTWLTYPFLAGLTIMVVYGDILLFRL